MRVVLDTNVLISGLLYGGKPDEILRMASRRQFTLILSEAILLELHGVLQDKFGWSARRIDSTLIELEKFSELAVPVFRVAECEDPDDDRILEAAVAGGADAIVTGDKHLLRMKSFREIEIVAVSDFLRLLASRS